MDLLDSLRKHDLERLAALLEAGADPNVEDRDPPNFRPLHIAIDELEEGGSVEALVLLLCSGAEVDAWDGGKSATPLLMAVFRRQHVAVMLLLAAGADPNVVGAEGDSPLRWCVEQRDHALAATLLRCGAKRSIDFAGGPSGMTALGRAAWLLDLPMVELLLNAGAGRLALDADQRTALDRLPPDPEEPEARKARAAILARLSARK